MSIKLLLLRHGHVAGIEPPRFRGLDDLPLSEAGRAQAAEAAAYIALNFKVAAVYSSPLSRCWATATTVGNALVPSLVPQTLHDLTDLDYGCWQGRSHEEISIEQPTVYRAWLASPDAVRFPKGEALEEAAVRATRALRFATALVANNPLLFVTHKSTIRLLLLEVLGLPLSRYWSVASDPCGLSVLERRQDEWTVHCLNETAYISHKP